MLLNFEVAGLEGVHVSLYILCFVLSYLWYIFFINDTIWIDDETATLDFSSEVVSNQCLNLLQNANQNFHAKRTLVDDFCLMGLESTFWLEWEDRMAFDRKSQVGNNGCIPNATEECKAAALEFFSTLPETIHDENLKECWNQTNFRRGSRDYHRENDFLLLFLKMIVFDTQSKDQMDSTVDIFTKTCQPLWFLNYKLLENNHYFNWIKLNLHRLSLKVQILLIQ